MKGISTDFLRPFLDSKVMAGMFAVGEFFDGDAGLVRTWVFGPARHARPVQRVRLPDPLPARGDVQRPG